MEKLSFGAIHLFPEYLLLICNLLLNVHLFIIIYIYIKKSFMLLMSKTIGISHTICD